MNQILKGFAVTLVVVLATAWWSWSGRLSIVSFYALPTVSFLLLVFLPTQKWFIGGLVFIGLALAAIFGYDAYVTSLPTYSSTGSPGDGLGLAFVMLVVMGVIMGALIRAILHAAWSRFGKPNKTLQPIAPKDGAPVER